MDTLEELKGEEHYVYPQKDEFAERDAFQTRLEVGLKAPALKYWYIPVPEPWYRVVTTQIYFPQGMLAPGIKDKVLVHTDAKDDIRRCIMPSHISRQQNEIPNDRYQRS